MDGWMGWMDISNNIPRRSVISNSGHYKDYISSQADSTEM